MFSYYYHLHFTNEEPRHREINPSIYIIRNGLTSCAVKTINNRRLRKWGFWLFEFSG